MPYKLLKIKIMTQVADFAMACQICNQMVSWVIFSRISIAPKHVSRQNSTFLQSLLEHHFEVLFTIMLGCWFHLWPQKGLKRPRTVIFGVHPYIFLAFATTFQWHSTINKTPTQKTKKNILLNFLDNFPHTKRAF